MAPHIHPTWINAEESLQMSPAFRRAARRENWRDGGEAREGAAGGGNGLMK